MFEDAARDALDDMGALDVGWEYDGGVLTCPCGYDIEDDGECPHGCLSPFLAAGLI
jgi:hypothetical protein